MTTGGQFSPATPEARQTLARRARRLARPLPQVPDVESLDVLVVRAGRERYGLPARHIGGVEPAPPITPLPGDARWAGLAVVRGALLPVLDLASLLGAAPASEPERAMNGAAGAGVLAVVRHPGGTVGVLVDEVLEVRRLPTSEIAPPRREGPAPSHFVVRGTTPGMVTVLDLAGPAVDGLPTRHEEDP